MTMFRQTPAGARRFAALAAVGAGTLLAAACGSSGSSTSGATSTATAANAQLSAVQQVLTQAMVRPTSITVAKPIGKPVPAGKKIVFISCGTAECQLQGTIVAQAASVLGWTSSTIATDGSPTQIQGAYETAIREKANGIVTTAALRAEISGQIPALEANNIVVSDASSVDPIQAPFIYNTSTPAQNGRIGKYLAAEVVGHSGGKANTVYVDLPAFPILAQLGQSFKQYYNQWCETCGYSLLDVSITQLPNAANIIVSFLRSHPSYHYVALSVADALDTGLPAAISAAGLSNISIVGQGGRPTDYQYLASGQELALVPFDFFDSDYQMVDALARHFAGVPVELTATPLWLVTKANLPANYKQPFADVVGYVDEFKALWGKG
jgi:ribose transport system substrate-binding protein